MALIRGVRDLAHSARVRLSADDPLKREEAGLAIVQRIAHLAAPNYIVTEYGKSWFHDRDFLRDYDRLVPGNRRSADRKYFLRSILSLIDGRNGDTAECGVWNGSSSWFICKHFEGTGKRHHGFDSFEGLSSPGVQDGSYWRAGDLRTAEAEARATLAGFNVRLYRGWIPDRFQEVTTGTFCFVHIDVDLYQPTMESVRFFYPRTVEGGILLFDDYGFQTCPGARQAVDEFFRDKPEPVVHVPTGQAFVIRG